MNSETTLKAIYRMELLMADRAKKVLVVVSFGSMSVKMSVLISTRCLSCPSILEVAGPGSAKRPPTWAIKDKVFELCRVDGASK